MIDTDYKLTNANGERRDADVIIEDLKGYDVVSFDIFDTLVLRPLSNPKDVFKLLSVKYQMVNFSELRIKAQRSARARKKRSEAHTEVTLQEIYDEMNLLCGIDALKGVESEFQLEKTLMYANDHMKRVFDGLVKAGKTIILVSDMYYTHEMIEEILSLCGYEGYDKLYVSSTYNLTKILGQGEIFDMITRERGRDLSYMHIGDHEKSDYTNPRSNGWDSALYKMTSSISHDVDTMDMHSIIGSAYKALVKDAIFNRQVVDKKSSVYEYYGYVYSGIFLLGYVNWIHDQALKNGTDKILFLSRDGYILKQIYDTVYPTGAIDSEYVPWSRYAALMTQPAADIKRFTMQFIRRPAAHGRVFTVRDILQELSLMSYADELSLRGVHLNDQVDRRIASILAGLIEGTPSLLDGVSRDSYGAAREYYRSQVAGNKKVDIVDIGYRASGGFSLKRLFGEWGFACEVRPVVAFNFANHGAFDNPLGISESVNSYVFSSAHNLDAAYEFQDDQMMNIAIVDILTASAPKPSFLYFDRDEKGDVCERYEDEDTGGYESVTAVHRGALNFIRDYTHLTHDNPTLMKIPGIDAFGPIRSLTNNTGKKLFVNDFAEYSYDLLLSGRKSQKEVVLRDVYESFHKEAGLVATLVQAGRRKANKVRRRLRRKGVVRYVTKLKKMVRRLKKIYKDPLLRARIYYTEYHERLSVGKNTILLQSYAGDNFSGNPYYMYKDLKARYSDRQFRYYIGVKQEAVKSVKQDLESKGIEDVSILTLHSAKYCKILATAEYLINNVAFPVYFIKKKDQKYVNTWHGTPLKGLGRSIQDAPHESGNYQRNFLMTDYMVMPNEFTRDVMARDYMIEGEFTGEYITSGYPRNSIFHDDMHKELVRKRLGLEGKRVIVYMPTWRRSYSATEEVAYPEVSSLLDTLNTWADQDTVIYVKLHNMMREGLDLEGMEAIRSFPVEYETYEFLSIADCLITDYSSVMFDYANTKQPIILYQYDQADYMSSRSVYMDMEDLPFPIVKTQEALMKVLTKTPKMRYGTFLRKFCSDDQLSTCARINDYIFGGIDNDINILQGSKSNVSNELLYIGDLSSKHARNMLDIVKSSRSTEKKYWLSFYFSKIARDKLKVNDLPHDVNYITLQGAKNLRVVEGVCLWAYNKFNIRNNPFVNSKIERIYTRETQRLFPGIEFDRALDVSCNSIEALKLVSHTPGERSIVSPASFRIPRLFSKYKKELQVLQDRFTSILISDANWQNLETEFETVGAIRKSGAIECKAEKIKFYHRDKSRKVVK